jgi:hypothetical protein
MVGCLSRIGVDDAALAQSAGERVVRVVPTDGRRMSKRAASCLRQSETHGCSGMSRFTAGSLCSGSLTLRKTLNGHLNVRRTLHMLSGTGYSWIGLDVMIGRLRS